MQPVAADSRRDQLQAWGDWLSSTWDWDLFVTLTHDNSEEALGRGTRTIVGWKASADRWDRFMDEAIAPRLPPGAGPVRWVRGREPNPWRKGTHFHALIGGVGDISRRDLWRWWFEEQEFGLARILPYDPSLGAAHYLTKYVVKDLGDIVFSESMGRPGYRPADQALPQHRTNALDRWGRLDSNLDEKRYERSWGRMQQAPGRA